MTVRVRPETPHLSYALRLQVFQVCHALAKNLKSDYFEPFNEVLHPVWSEMLVRTATAAALHIILTSLCRSLSPPSLLSSRSLDEIRWRSV